MYSYNYGHVSHRSSVKHAGELNTLASRRVLRTQRYTQTDVGHAVIAETVGGGKLVSSSQREDEGVALVGAHDNCIFLSGQRASLRLHCLQLQPSLLLAVLTGTRRAETLVGGACKPYTLVYGYIIESTWKKD